MTDATGVYIIVSTGDCTGDVIGYWYPYLWW